MRSHLFSISPGLPFLPTLAAAILDGRVVPGAFGERDDPLRLAGLTVLVPTRRAARALNAEFARRLGGASAILPAIRPLGETDETSLFTLEDGGGGGLLPVVDELQRRLLLARLVRFWKARLREGLLQSLAGGAEAPPPASSADALWLASDLGRLLDEVANEEAALGGLATLAPDRFAEWWQLTLVFLEILTRHWPEHLAEKGLVDAAVARNFQLAAEAERFRTVGSKGPVVIAGSTATAPATVELMRAVAQMENGAVVLPGLDRHLADEDFAAITRARSIASPGHPQYGLKRILERLVASRDDVAVLGPEDGGPRVWRERFVSDALRPAETTDAWGEAAGSHPPEALDGLALVEGRDEREEALAIAVAVRDALSDPDATVALTTPDRNLARRVVAELLRFGVAANDSAGRPLGATPPGTLVDLVLRTVFSPGDPIAILQLLKHPLTRLGFSAADARRAARTVEMIALRGGVGVADVATLSDLYRRRRASSEAADAYPPRVVQLLSPGERDHAAEVARRLAEALEPLVALRGGAHREIADFAEPLTRALEAIARGEDGAPDELYAFEAGAALATFLQALVAAPPADFPFAPEELPDVVSALAADVTVRPRGGLSTRVFVWGALEARLQCVDVMILGGLNEGTWPQGARSDAFLSRLMRAELALDPPERRIGLAAHDFWMALGSPRVVLARSARSGGAPAIPSRWLQRLLTLAGPEGAARLRAAGEPFLAHARELDHPAEVPPAVRPEPCPPLGVRPVRISVTEVETLIRDPYAIHARRILKLEPLPDLLRDPGAAERGNLYHAILDRFAREVPEPTAEDAADRLIAIAREEFARENLPPEIEAVWWPRMETMAENVVAWEAERALLVAKRHAEIRGEWLFPDIGIRLTGKADRIDRLHDGRIEILDYKTGTYPSVRQARALLSPQLPLEGAMAGLGAFAEIGPAEAAELTYVRLRERDFYEEHLSHAGSKSTPAIGAADLSSAALEKFRQLAGSYQDPAKGYLSRARPPMAGDFSGDYDHLARAREWSLAVGEDEAEEER